MMMRVVDAEQAEGIQPMRLVTTACISAKNRMVNKLGLSPLQAVTGRNTSIPTSLVDQAASGCLKEALNREFHQSDSLRRAERIRAAACDAFHCLEHPIVCFAQGSQQTTRSIMDHVVCIASRMHKHKAKKACKEIT